ncbi:28S ribosomal protein S17 [Schistosoma japonicum]|uniref:28S ribosomal protein S17 n=1 Tax=Schistosoma japonicum TaxID=6182 RepID=Q5DD29_SCHJA|nr:SJCHGC04492 protein [Schistosoma japonicum]KAH8874267.1 28S ribosomal protein S17, mitochondrial [Schistosoma japonicum]KAH8874268.1 28S ribosomal protein S17, mitochondrial [Schistosoma japonicum]KAH8874269.1 28S ribosomal protein S17, mitochondrial [Schistosoma japonicum]KAH8874270.1 28S ribosomal protein S17, mitochondrial [Schistosoma japonicum]
MVRYWKHRGEKIFKCVQPHIQKYFPYHKPELEGTSPQSVILTGKKAKIPFDYAIGQIVPFSQSLTSSFPDIVKVRLHKLCLNRFLMKYFYQTATYWVHTQGLPVNIGDIVLIEKSDPPIAFNTMYKLKKVEFPVGNLIDPVTGQRSEGPEYSIEALKSILNQQNNTLKNTED